MVIITRFCPNQLLRAKSVYQCVLFINSMARSSRLNNAKENRNQRSLFDWDRYLSYERCNVQNLNTIRLIFPVTSILCWICTVILSNRMTLDKIVIFILSMSCDPYKRRPHLCFLNFGFTLTCKTGVHFLHHRVYRHVNTIKLTGDTVSFYIWSLKLIFQIQL